MVLSVAGERLIYFTKMIEEQHGLEYHQRWGGSGLEASPCIRKAQSLLLQCDQQLLLLCNHYYCCLREGRRQQKEGVVEEWWVILSDKTDENPPLLPALVPCCSSAKQVCTYSSFCYSSAPFHIPEWQETKYCNCTFESLTWIKAAGQGWQPRALILLYSPRFLHLLTSKEIVLMYIEVGTRPWIFSFQRVKPKWSRSPYTNSLAFLLNHVFGESILAASKTGVSPELFPQANPGVFWNVWFNNILLGWIVQTMLCYFLQAGWEQLS